MSNPNCRKHLEIIQRQEGFRFSSLLFNVLDAVTAGLLRVHDDGVHVFAQHFGNGDLVLLLSGLAQIYEPAILERKKKGL